MAEVPLPTPTQVPVPSTDIRNAVFAGAKLDEEVTGTGEFYTDRLGVKRLTNTGRNNQFNAAQQDRESRFNSFIQSSGYEVVGDYTAGPLTLTEYNQLIRYNNELYKLTAATDIPYTTAGTTDETWNATDSLHFVSVGDAALRQNLGSEEPGFGTFMIMHKKRFRNSTNMAKIIDGRDGFNFTEVLPDNYLEYISPYLTAAETIDAIWNTSSTTDSHAVIKSILLCLWAFVGVESAAVSTGMVKNPKRTVPLATMLGTAMAGIVYIAATQVIAGMYPASQMAASGAPFAISASTILGGWAAPMVSAFTAFACLTSLGSWMMLVGQAGVRAANDGNFPKVYGEVDNNGIPKKGLLLAAVKMTALMVLITLMNSAGGKASDLFGELTGIAVLLTMLPYFYSCVDLIRFEGINIRNFVSLICSVLGCVFCFIALMGASSFELAGTFIVSLIILMFYGRKMHQRQNNASDNNTTANAH